jgi:uncharacterized protein (TIGR02246 family)
MLKLVSLTVFASLAGSAAFAQQPADLQSEAEKVARRYEAAINKQDAAGVAAIFASKDAVYVPVTGKAVEGREQIERLQSQVFTQNDGLNATITAEKVIPIGDGAAAIGHGVFIAAGNKQTYTHWQALYIRESGDLKIKMLTVGVDAAMPQSPTK